MKEAKKKIDNIISTTQEYLDRIHEIDKKEAKKQ
jgi:F0F1-type ATP synthase membrane subunit b/b'